MNLLHDFDRIQRPRILVLGDLMLDQYTWGAAQRTSQEAPVVVLQVQNREQRLGGASNVCYMLKVLSADVTCAGVIGDDLPGQTIARLLERAGIDTHLVLRCPDRVTTQKERFVGRSGSGLPGQILRVDTETTGEIAESVEKRLVEGFRSQIPHHDVVLISDYAKGVCTTRCVQETIEIARQAGVPVLVDPGRDVDFSIYRHATLIKPNRGETESATKSRIRHPADALRSGSELCQQLDLEMAVITLDSEGMALVRKTGEGQVYSTQARSVYDITGAGDMVLAVLGLCFGGGVTPDASVQLANIAAGLEVDRTGVTALTRDEIRTELASPPISQRKQANLQQAARFASDCRQRGKSVVFTNGCFDLLHVGHVTYLEEAAAYGDVLIVGVNNDESVRRLKGPQRPIISQADRLAMLASLACVDRVVLFDEDTPHAMLAAIRPDVLVKGGTYQPHEVVGREVVDSYGGRVCITRLVKGVSTTRIVESMKKTSQQIPNAA